MRWCRRRCVAHSAAACVRRIGWQSGAGPLRVHVTPPLCARLCHTTPTARIPQHTATAKPNGRTESSARHGLHCACSSSRTGANRSVRRSHFECATHRCCISCTSLHIRAITMRDGACSYDGAHRLLLHGSQTRATRASTHRGGSRGGGNSGVITAIAIGRASSETKSCPMVLLLDG